MRESRQKPSQGDLLYEKADNLKNAGDYQVAISIFEKARKFYERDEKWAEYLNTSNHIAGCQYYLSQYDAAISISNHSLIKTLPRLGEFHPEVAMSYNNIGTAYGRKGDYENQLKYYQKALMIQERQPHGSRTSVELSYNNIGACFRFVGDVDKALIYYFKALNIRVKRYGEMSQKVANSYNNIGSAYGKMGEYALQLKYLKKSSAIYSELLPGSHHLLGIAYNNLGECYHHLNKPERAITYFKKAEQTFLKGIGGNNTYLATSYGLLSDSYGSIGNSDMQRLYLSKGFDIAHGLFGDKHPGISKIHLKMGRYFKSKSHVSEELNCYQKAICSLFEGYNSMDIYHFPPTIEGALSQPVLLQCLIHKGEALLELYHSRTNRIKAAKAALTALKLADVLLNDMRKNYIEEESKIILAEQARQVYDKAVEISLLLFDHDDDKRWLHEAFRFSEKSKAILLFNSMKDTEAKFTAKIPDHLLISERELRVRRAHLVKSIQDENLNGGKDSGASAFQDELFDVNRKYESLVRQFENHYPDYHQLKYSAQVATVRSIQSRLEPDDALIDYFIGETNFLVFLITDKSFKVVRTAVPQDFEIRVSEFVSSINQIEKKPFIENGMRLHDDLIKPVKRFIADKKHLIIVPDLGMYYLPFEALLTKSADFRNSYRGLPYLANKFTVSYHYSASLFHHSVSASAQRNRTGMKTFIGISPEYGNRRKHSGQFIELIFSKEEVTAVGTLLSESGFESKAICESEATAARFKSMCAGFNYILISAHQVLHQKSSGISGIIFSPSPEDKSENDRCLTIGEAYNLNLSANLVVLSCCETGIGKLIKGEGMMAMNRAFLFAGAENIVFTLFKVFDSASSQLVQYFFEEIIKGARYAEALRTAKLKIIKQEWATPKAWAGYVFMGKPHASSSGFKSLPT